MSVRRIGFLIIVLIIGFSSCNEDDGFGGPTPINIAEKYVSDSTAISDYLKTHYYNSSRFDGGSGDANDIIIGELGAEGDAIPTGNALLMNNVEMKSYVLGDITYHYYILNIRQGSGAESPKFCDNVLIGYEGYRISDDVVFDARLNPNLANLDLTTTIRGWQLAVPEFNTASELVDNGDGTFIVEGSGLGMMFLPSGLAYLFNANNTLQLQNLAFKFQLVKSFENDHDEDGVPSWKEDIDEDNQFTIDPSEPDKEGDDDTDNNGTVDYLDADDDGDGVLTIDEDMDCDGDPTNDMSPINPTIPRYLDPEVLDTKNC
ncbi:MAG: hypothetical protein ACON5F_04245 [Jejuia sp.]